MIRTTNPVNPPCPNPSTKAVRFAITSIPKTEPPVKTNHKIVTGKTAKRSVDNPPKNPAIILITFSI